tara:strand:+ start:135 stop:383 length:249 start_codon:yes stop_codon:yes gene_type:complete
MKILFISLLGMFMIPTAVNAESVWLVMRYATSIKGEDGVAAAIEKIEMENMTQCELMGAKWISSKAKPEQRSTFHFACIKGK